MNKVLLAISGQGWTQGSSKGSLQAQIAKLQYTLSLKSVLRSILTVYMYVDFILLLINVLCVISEMYLNYMYEAYPQS